MKRKIILFLAVLRIFACLLAISVSVAEMSNYCTSSHCQPILYPIPVRLALTNRETVTVIEKGAVYYISGDKTTLTPVALSYNQKK